MSIKIRGLRKQDENKAIQFAIKGMHFDWYMDSKLALQLYGRYFWYLETSRATQIFAAYNNDQFVGVLLADVKGEPKKYHSTFRKGYVNVFEWIQRTFLGDSVGTYDLANREMYKAFCQKHKPDGELIFLAADPDAKIRGVGSALLKVFENHEKGKCIYLYTDNACTYQFYEHRGFDRVGEKDIVLDMGKKKVPLKCLMYSKVLGE